MWDLKTPSIKNSKYESQAKKKKMILIVISTISHFPTLTNFWQFVFVSLFSMIYTPSTHKYSICGGLKLFVVCPVAKGWEDFKFLGELLY